ncbi:MAG: transcription elongation factor GreA [Betaproteobacteria bacterium]|nr:transcription elongation factor GreA [Betaproteobacteria bacterium]
MEKLLLTEPGRKRLTEELDLLKTTERPAIIKAIAEARAHGDLKENAEYHSAKEKQGFIERRIKELEGVLAHGEVFAADADSAGGKVLFGCRVTIKDDDGNKRNFRLVSKYETDTAAGMIAITSPLGKALVGKSVGDIAEVKAPAGTVEYEIVAVDYPAS